MESLRWPEVALGLTVVVLLLLGWWSRRQRPRPGVLLAHAARLRVLPRYRALARRQRAAAVLAALGALLVVAGSVALAGRPQQTVYAEPERGGRDVVLCLDASSSMDRWNRQVVGAFRQLVDDLAGERVALSIFSGASVTVFPLTDDYEYVRGALDRAERAFATGDYEFFVGAETFGDRSSQVGDGLVGCVDALGSPEATRGRAVVLASDNDPVGRPVFTLAEAADEAARASVVVYGIATPDVLAVPDRLRSFTAATEATGGTLAVVGRQGNTAEEVVRGIQQLDRARLARRPTSLVLDAPRVPFLVALGGFALLLPAVLVRRPR